MWGKRDDMTVHEHEPFNAEPARAALAVGHLTPTDTFYTRNHGPVPELDPGRWRLRVDGLVRDDLDLSLDDLAPGFEHHGWSRRCSARATVAPGCSRCATSPASTPGDRAPRRRPPGPVSGWPTCWPRPELDPAAGHVAFEAPDVSPSAHPAPAVTARRCRCRRRLSPEVLLAWG